MKKAIVCYFNKLYYCNIIKENPWPENKGFFLLEFLNEIPEDLFSNSHKRMWFHKDEILFE